MSLNWKEMTRAAWDEIDLSAFCSQIGIDFKTIFLSPLSNAGEATNPYEGYRWEIMHNRRIKPGVLHLVPSYVSENATVWEEWFIGEALLAQGQSNS